MMALSVVIPSFNTRDLTLACLRSLAQAMVALDGEVLVVDNASTDGSADAVAGAFPSVRLIRRSTNGGFAAACNEGIRAAGGAAMLLLNSDTEVQAGCLETLLEYLSAHERTGAVGGRLINPNGCTQPSCSTFITLRTLLFEQLFLDRLFPRSRLFGGHFLTWWPYDAVRPVDVLSGACVAIRRDCLDAVGLLDEGYFMYCEDVDWCLRAARLGWERVFLPEARVLHHHGASSRRDRSAMIVTYNRSRCRYFRKFHGPAQARAARALCTAGAALRAIAWTAAGAGSPAARSKARQWRQVLRETASIPIGGL